MVRATARRRFGRQLRGRRVYLRAVRYPGTTSLVDGAEQYFQDTAS